MTNKSVLVRYFIGHTIYLEGITAANMSKTRSRLRRLTACWQVLRMEQGYA